MTWLMFRSRRGAASAEPSRLILGRLDELRARRADLLARIPKMERRNDMRALGRARRALQEVTLEVLAYEAWGRK